jgi:hypothetical protein
MKTLSQVPGQLVVEFTLHTLLAIGIQILTHFVK